MKQIFRHRAGFIGFVSVLMTAAILLIGESISDELSVSIGESGSVAAEPPLSHERNVFRRAGEALRYLALADVPATRTLAQFYERRAYPGAPPVIPHELESEQGIGAKVCLSCHENGGYVPKFNAFAPVVPHPEFVNCRQCHVPTATPSVFRTSSFRPRERPAIGLSAMPDSPPMMPHDLQMRDNCLACHAGPAAPQEIRVTHPERSNCRQCHLPLVNPDVWTRPVR